MAPFVCVLQTECLFHFLEKREPNIHRASEKWMSVMQTSKKAPNVRMPGLQTSTSAVHLHKGRMSELLTPKEIVQLTWNGRATNVRRANIYTLDGFSNVRITDIHRRIIENGDNYPMKIPRTSTIWMSGCRTSIYPKMENLTKRRLPELMKISLFAAY